MRNPRASALRDMTGSTTRARGTAALMIVMVMIVSPDLGSGQASRSQPGPPPGKVYPVDQGTSNPEFFVFRARLMDALSARDTTALYEVIAPDILNSFGGNGGLAEFKEMWQPGAADSQVWTALAGVLSRGGRFQADGSFVAPYTAYAAEAFEQVIVVDLNVVARAGPSATADSLSTLDFDVLGFDFRRAGGYTPDAQWRPVLLPDGREAWVEARYLVTATDLRAGFARRGGKWLLIYLVAGD